MYIIAAAYYTRWWSDNKVYLIQYSAYGRYLIPADGHVEHTFGSASDAGGPDYLDPFIIVIYVVKDGT